MATPGHLFYLATTANRNILKINVLLRVRAVHAIVMLYFQHVFSADDKLQKVRLCTRKAGYYRTYGNKFQCPVIATISLRVHFNRHNTYTLLILIA